MRRTYLFLMLAAFCHLLSAQNVSNRVTAYPDFKSAIVLLANGNALKVGKKDLATDPSLLMLRAYALARNNALGDHLFDGDAVKSLRLRVRYGVGVVNTVHCLCQKHAVGSDTVVDMEAYNMQMANKRQITNLEISSQVSMTALVSPDDEQEYPLNDYYYFKYNGKFVKAMELYVLRSVPKAKRRLFWAIVREPGFSWTNKDSLMRLLQTIS